VVHVGGLLGDRRTLFPGREAVLSDTGVNIGDDLARDFVALELSGLYDVRREFPDIDDAAGELGLADDPLTAGSVGELRLTDDCVGVGLNALSMLEDRLTTNGTDACGLVGGSGNGDDGDVLGGLSQNAASGVGRGSR